MAKKLLVVNTAITFLVLIVLITMISYVILIFRKTKGYISTLADTFFMDTIKTKYISILYPKSLEMKLDIPCKYNFTFLTACLMSCYNIKFGYDNLFPNYIKYINNIGDYGFLLKCEKYYILCFRGTVNGLDIYTDLDGVQTNFIDINGKTHEKLKIHRGFHSIWRTIVHKIKELSKIKNLVIVGHSLGGACANIVGLGLYLYTGKHPYILTFGSPKFGNKESAEIVNSINIVNKNDFVPSLPPSVIRYTDDLWLYSCLNNVFYMDIQTGNTFKNHSLLAYSYGVLGTNITENSINILWCKSLIYYKK